MNDLLCTRINLNIVDHSTLSVCEMTVKDIAGEVSIA
jgi:hypothetical protein